MTGLGSTTTTERYSTNYRKPVLIHSDMNRVTLFILIPYVAPPMQQEAQPNIIGYLRVSTEEQARSGLGMEAQRSRIIDEADRRGWAITWACDDGYTASNLNRPALTAALASLRSGDAAGLVVAKLDRLSRSLDLGVDMSTPSGEMLANVLASFAQYERRLISQRTTDALAALRAQGVVLGRPRVVSPAVAERIGVWRSAGGCTWQAIADHLNREGVPTGHGGVRWYASTVRQVWASYERSVA
jgi:DNA invertase Pin-like site-specific DNA recombinase